MAVEVDRNVRSHPLACASDQIPNRLGGCDADRVDHHDLLRASLDRGLVDRLEVVRVRARAIDPEECDGDPLFHGKGDRIDDPFEHRFAVDAERLELEAGDRRLDHARADSELGESLHVGIDRPRESPDLRVEARSENQLHRTPIVGGDAWESRFDPFDAELVETTRELELVLGTEHHSDGLLTVAKRGVVEADVRLEGVGLVQLAGPESHRVT